MSDIDRQRAEVAWIEYRNEYQRQQWVRSGRHAERQMRKREFIAGFLAATDRESDERQGGADE